jgi:hypothetical protein
MNLGTQQEWFHNFWDIYTSRKNSSKFASKTKLSSILKSLKQENRFPSVAQLRSPRAQHAPTHAAHGRGSPRAGKQAETTPNSTENNPRPMLLFLLSALLH